MQEPILSVQNLSKSFGELKALNKVSLAVPKNSITLVIGPNGSGKTTLINVICGFLKPDEGMVMFEGKEITGKKPHELYKLGIVRTFQITKPLKKLSVLENILIAKRYAGEGVTSSLRNSWLKDEEELVEKAFHILEFLELDHLWYQEAGKLSGGQSKLLEIGRALMADAKLIIMDEPIASIAPALCEKLVEKLRQLVKLNVTVFMVEHRLEVVLGHVDHVYVMAGGRIIAEGSSEEVLNNPTVVEAYLGSVYQDLISC